MKRTFMQTNANAAQTISQAAAQMESEIDYQFILRVQNEVTGSCALPIAIPADRIPEYIIQAANWFWLNDDSCVEERMYVIPNAAVCKCTQMNKLVQLPHQIQNVHGCYKIQPNMKWGAMGDFSLERMMLTTYSMFGGVGTVANGFNGTTGMAGFSLSDVVTSLYEVDTFNQVLNAPLTYNYNPNSHKLVLLGDLGYSDLLINCWQRCRIQDLYNYYYFFRFVVCMVKMNLSTIYGTFEFKYPGGVTINYSNFSDAAKDELDEIKEWVANQHAVDYFFQPNTL